MEKFIKAVVEYAVGGNKEVMAEALSSVFGITKEKAMEAVLNPPYLPPRGSWPIGWRYDGGGADAMMRAVVICLEHGRPIALIREVRNAFHVDLETVKRAVDSIEKELTDRRKTYQALISREGKFWLAEFPDCPGCQTFAESEAELREAAREALQGWLEAQDGDLPPRTYLSTVVRGCVPEDKEVWTVVVFVN